MNYIFVLATALFGGVVYRIRGSELPIPEWFCRALFSIPFGFAAGVYWGQSDLSAFFAIFWVVLITDGAVSTGHANWQSMGNNYSSLPHPPNWLESLIIKLKPELSPFWYDFLGMSLSGLVITFPAGVAVQSPALAFSGILKALAYTIGWKFFNKVKSPIEPTQAAEFLTGFFVYAALAAVML